MIQQPVPTYPALAAAAKSIPQHVAERLESEWKQVRDSAPAPTPAPQR